jgi:hypothetical protein
VVALIKTSPRGYEPTAPTVSSCDRPVSLCFSS